MRVIEVPAFTEKLDFLNLHFNLKPTFVSQKSFHQRRTVQWCNFYFSGGIGFSFPTALWTPYVSYTATFIPVCSPNTGIHLSLHCGNWHSMVGAIVNMAVLDWYKQAPVTPQAKLVCEAGRGCCLLCLQSLCRFAVGPFLIAFSYTLADSFCIFNCQVKSFCRQSV